MDGRRRRAEAVRLRDALKLLDEEVARRRLERRAIIHLREQQAVDRLLGVDVVDEPRLALLLERAHLVLLGEREQRDGALVADERRVARVKVLEEELELADRLAHERHRRARDHRVGRVEEPAEDW